MTLDTNQHKTILISILKEIYSQNTLGKYLGFKGGTAAMLFYDLNRFSIDLDFDLLDDIQGNYVSITIETILKQYGIVKEAREKRYSHVFILSYHNKLNNAQNIKVEINKRNFGSHYTIVDFLGIPMQIMIRQDMAAHTLVDLYERMEKANRDVYGAWFFLHNQWPINKNIIQQRTNMSYESFLHACIKKLELLPNNTILSGLGELLNASQKVWVKTKLKADLLFLLKLALKTESQNDNVV